MKNDAFLCSKPECTFAITGTCLETIAEPTRNCPHLKPKDITLTQLPADDSRAETQTTIEPVRQFSSGLELGLQDVSRLMRSRYARLVGVLGEVEAGKTCLFTSMYLQLTGRHLCPTYRFVASETLLGFEQRARHLRDWSQGGIPDQIVDHTQLGHSRSPAFLHLAFQDSDGVRHDLLLPDLPGEWTTRLLSDGSTASRFAFLARADVVLLVLEAPRFANPRTRNNAVTDAIHMLERLAGDVKLAKTIPIVLAITKCDKTAGQVPAEIGRVVDVVTAHGYVVETLALAAFPMGNPQIHTGFGIDKLVARLTSPSVSATPDVIDSIDGAGRSYLKARGH